MPGPAGPPTPTTRPTPGNPGSPGLPWVTPAPASPQSGRTGTSHAAIDLRPHIAGILRLIGALALALTALGTWWAIDAEGASDAADGSVFDDSYDDAYDSSDESTFHRVVDFLGGHASIAHHVLPLVGVIGVILAVVAQIVLLPGVAGANVAPRARLLIRAVLCLPALAAVFVAPVLLLITPEHNVPAFAQVLLAAAAGLALAGLDDERDPTVSAAVRWGTVVFAVAGVLAPVVAIIKAFAEMTGDLDAAASWTLALVIAHYLLVAAVGALIAYSVIVGRAHQRGLVSALAVALTVCALLRAWMQHDFTLAGNYLVLVGPGLPFVALAAATASSPTAWNSSDVDTDDAHSAAERWTQWVPAAFTIAAVTSALEFCLMVGARIAISKAPDEYASASEELNNRSREVADVIGFSPKLPTSTGTVWMAVLLALLTLIYGTLATVVRRQANGRMLAVVVVPVAVLTVLITYAAASVFAIVSLTFDAFALWLPLLAVAALVLPPSVRAAYGPVTPRRVVAPSDAATTPGAAQR